ncbi:MAG TPA: cobalamin biosynthesis protein, partial [Kofleriaceae bacterium]
ERFGWPIVTYSAEELDAVPGITAPSEVVKRHVGTRAVAEPAALLAAGTGAALVVPKERYTEPEAGRSMTLAVARIAFARRPVAPRTQTEATAEPAVRPRPHAPEVTP